MSGRITIRGSSAYFESRHTIYIYIYNVYPANTGHDWNLNIDWDIGYQMLSNCPSNIFYILASDWMAHSEWNVTWYYPIIQDVIRC